VSGFSLFFFPSFLSFCFVDFQSTSFYNSSTFSLTTNANTFPYCSIVCPTVAYNWTIPTLGTSLPLTSSCYNTTMAYSTTGLMYYRNFECIFLSILCYFMIYDSISGGYQCYSDLFCIYYVPMQTCFYCWCHQKAILECLRNSCWPVS
jgi:hypothetical protein